MTLKNVFNLSNLTLLTALTLSGIAAWYSILGLMAIFAAAVIPIIVMGSSLEVGKVVATMWLQRYWNRCGWVFKVYLVPAVVALAFLTSMGIFGFLSKAHIDQGVPTGDVSSKIAVLDERIKTERENIVASRLALAKMNAQVDQRLTRGDTEKGAERAIQVRRQQTTERNKLAKEITEAQQKIAKLNEERAPIASQLRKVEAEVGPIKYIAALIYGDNPDQGILERAVRWVIILIVFVFDPLALALVLAANASRKWTKEDEIVVVQTNAAPQVEMPKVTPKVHSQPKAPEAPEGAAPIDSYLPKINSEPPPMPQVKRAESQEISKPSEEQLIAPLPIVRAPEPVAMLPEPEEVSVQEAPSEVITDGVTIEKPFKDLPGDYVISDGKQIHRNALKELHPEYFRITADSANQSNSNFGTLFPRTANKGDTFVRVDMLPNKVYKFDGTRWIELVKTETTPELHDDYIQYLITKIDAGEYNVDLLSDHEKSRIEKYLKTHQS